MRHLTLFRFFGLVGLAVVVVTAALRPGADVPAANACSGGVANLEWYVDRVEYVAIVKVMSVGGPENTAPSVTPMPSPVGYPPRTPTPVEFDLTGVGATVRVIEDLLGNAPAQFEVDAGLRQQTEQGIRAREANPEMVAPCPIGFLVPKYEAGQKLLILTGTYDGSSDRVALLRYVIEGESATIGSDSINGVGTSLIVTRPTYDAYLQGVPYSSSGADEQGNESRHIVGVVPLDQLRDAMKGVFIGEPPSATSPALGRSPTRISPPDTGAAGLR